MKFRIGSIWPIFLIGFLLYHGLVIKAMRNEGVRQCYGLRDLRQEYQTCQKQITYLKTFFDFEKVIHAWD